jgi:capsular polysaccharide biosynthesis protein
MLLLTPFVTLLRVESPTGAIIHTPLWPPSPNAADLLTTLPCILETPAPVPGLPDILAMPGEQPRTVFLTRGARDLAVHPAQPAAFLRDHGAGRFPFLLIAPADLANLRDLIGHRWADPTGAETTPWPCPPFSLDLGIARMDLTQHIPSAQSAAMRLITTGGPMLLSRIGPTTPELLLNPAPPDQRPTEAVSQAAFHAAPDQTLPLPGAPENLYLPLTACHSDREWLYDRPYIGFPQITGTHTCRPRLVRQNDKYVMLARFCEGIVFDDHGIYSEFGFTTNLGSFGTRHLATPAGMRNERERLFLDRDVLAVAPMLPGPHIVFYNPNLPHYTHWLIDALLPLLVLLQHAPKDAKLLLPATLRGFADNPTRICDHHDILRAFGFADLPAVEIAAPFVRVEELYWLDDCFIHNMPAEQLRALRDRVASLRPPVGRRHRRLYIARRGTRKVANIAELWPLLDQNGFTTHTLDDLSIDEQIDLFSHAHFIIAPHGAELGNLLFCQPGTKLLELAPDQDFKPYFSYMCNKLGLIHGVLPCKTDTNDFNGNMQVDIRKFTALFRMLKIHL